VPNNTETTQNEPYYGETTRFGPTIPDINWPYTFSLLPPISVLFLSVILTCNHFNIDLGREGEGKGSA